jgi:hypothetical protein
MDQAGGQLMWSIVRKEYQQRARGLATLGLIITYTVILGGVAFVVYLGSYALLVNLTRTSGDVGLYMSTSTFVAQMIMALLLALSLNAATIAAEKDHETFDLLNLTLFKSFEIVVGKFISSTGFLFILVITALPIYALAFTFGGLELESFWQLAAVVAGMTLFVSSIGLFFSLVSADVRTAISRSFFALIILAAITLFFGYILRNSFSTAPPNVVTYWLGLVSMLVNPVFAAIDVLGEITGGTGIQWQAPLPVAVPFVVQGNRLWAFAAVSQTALAAIVLFITTLAYPRFRASKDGGI